MTEEQSRRNEITQYASRYIQSNVTATKRLRLLRRVIHDGVLLWLSGATFDPMAQADFLEALRVWPFQRDVRNEASRLISNQSLTVHDANWPDLSSYAAITELPSFWTSGIVMGRIAGLSAALSGKATIADIDSRIQSLVNASPAALDTLGEIAARLQNDESTASALTTTVAGKFNHPTGSTSQYIRGDGSLATFPALFSGSYADLSGKPSIPSAQVNSDWSATSGVSQILNKPTLFSGLYADLTGKPTLFSGAYADLTGRPTLFSGSYADLASKPTIPAAQVQSDWNAASGLGVILNKPTIPTQVALATAPPPKVGTGAVGVSTKAAREDHTHDDFDIINGGYAATTAVLLAGQTVDITIPLSFAYADTNYQAIAALTNAPVSLLGSVALTVKSKSAASLVVTIKNNALATLAIGQIVDVMCFHQ